MRVAISMHSEEPVRAYQGQSIVDEAHMCPRVQHQVLRLQITVEHPMRMHECANTQKTSEATKRIGTGGSCPEVTKRIGTGGRCPEVTKRIGTGGRCPEVTKRIGTGGRCPSTDILAGTDGYMAPRWHRRIHTRWHRLIHGA